MQENVILSLSKVYLAMVQKITIHYHLFYILHTALMVKDPTLTQLKKQTKNLCNAFLFLNDANEIFDFLRDILTEDEMKEFQQRMDIAVRLHYKTPYTEIEKELGVSSTTIARVSKYLK